MQGAHLEDSGGLGPDLERVRSTEWQPDDDDGGRVRGCCTFTAARDRLIAARGTALTGENACSEVAAWSAR